MNATGNTKSTPRRSGSGMAPPISAPASVVTFQTRKRLTSVPSTNGNRRVPRATETPYASSVRRYAPTTRSRRVIGTTRPSDIPYSTWRTFSRNVVSTISSPPAPRPNSPTALTCALPAKTNSDSACVSTSDSPASRAEHRVCETERRDAEPERHHRPEPVTELHAHSLDVKRGAALYVGALIGPGVLLVPALAVDSAGPASILAWAALLVLSAPLAVTFAALGVRHPVAGGVTAYVREGLGDAAAAVTGGFFVAAVFCGGPAVALIGGFYVADLTGSGTPVAAAVGLGMFGAVLAANAFGLRVSSGFQLVLASVLVVVIASAIAIALPSRGGDNWHPFAPHGWWADRHRGEHPRLAVRRLGGGSAARRRLPQPGPRPAALDGARVRRRDGPVLRARRRDDRRDVGRALAGAARRPHLGRLRPRRPRCDGRAGRGADHGDDERLHRRRVEADRVARRSRARCRRCSRATRTAASRAGRWC